MVAKAGKDSARVKAFQMLRHGGQSGHDLAEHHGRLGECRGQTGKVRFVNALR